MVDSVNYQHFKNLMEAHERAHSEKNMNTAYTPIGNVWKKLKADFAAANKLEEVVSRHLQKKSKMADFWSKAVQKIK